MTELFDDIAAMRDSGYDPSVIADREKSNQMVENFLSSPIGDHIRTIEGGNDVGVCGGGLFGSASLKDQAMDFFPGHLLFRQGYLPIWGCDGHLIVYGLNQQKFYFYIHDSWLPDGDMVFLPETGEAFLITESEMLKVLIEFAVEPPDRFILALVAGAHDERITELR